MPDDVHEKPGCPRSCNDQLVLTVTLCELRRACLKTRIIASWYVFVLFSYSPFFFCSPSGTNLCKKKEKRKKEKKKEVERET